MVRYGQTGSKNRIALTSTGAWSSAERLPMGRVEGGETGRALLWQIDHNGAWHAELGDRYDDVYLALSGSTDREHARRAPLLPGESFESVPAAVALVPGSGFEGAVAAMTGYRRALLRPYPDHERLPVVFNDINNCLMSDPSTAAILPLAEAAAEAGAEYCCTDAGWYADSDGWWDAVGSTGTPASLSRAARPAAAAATTPRSPACRSTPSPTNRITAIFRRSPSPPRLPSCRNKEPCGPVRRASSAWTRPVSHSYRRCSAAST